MSEDFLEPANGWNYPQLDYGSAFVVGEERIRFSDEGEDWARETVEVLLRRLREYGLGNVWYTGSEDSSEWAVKAARAHGFRIGLMTNGVYHDNPAKDGIARNDFLIAIGGNTPSPRLRSLLDFARSKKKLVVRLNATYKTVKWEYPRDDSQDI